MRESVASYHRETRRRGEASVHVLVPVQEPVVDRHGLAPRLKSLDGKVLGLYNNGKLNSVRLLALIAEELEAEFDFIVKTGHYPASMLMAYEDWGDVDDCDAVILANGDCGSCSSTGIANAIALERRGIPTMLVSTPPFGDAVRIMASTSGMPDITWAVVDHPIGSVTEDELRGRARSAAKQFVSVVLASADEAG
jgi:hypothetical protein